ncbi:MAG: hypothetical protein ACIPMY_06575 [Rickettsia endosymbiont of Pentastiridius leporinus]
MSMVEKAIKSDKVETANLIIINTEFNDLPLINKIVKLLKSEYYIIQITPKPELNEIDPVTVIGADDFTTIAK